MKEKWIMKEEMGREDVVRETERKKKMMIKMKTRGKRKQTGSNIDWGVLDERKELSRRDIEVG